MRGREREREGGRHTEGGGQKGREERERGGGTKERGAGRVESAREITSEEREWATESNEERTMLAWCRGVEHHAVNINLMNDSAGASFVWTAVTLFDLELQ